jgi:hypothetical protein
MPSRWHRLPRVSTQPKPFRDAQDPIVERRPLYLASFIQECGSSGDLVPGNAM